MKTNLNPDEARLSELLREARPTAALPPRFQQNVWQRIENSELPVRRETWLDALVARILRPRLAWALGAVLLVAGGFLGTKEGVQAAKHDAEARYVASVAPAFVR